MSEDAVWVGFAVVAALALALVRINPIFGYSRRRILALALLAVFTMLAALAVAWQPPSNVPTASGVKGPDGG
jgi:Co/Zn/Cd efflux system component